MAVAELRLDLPDLRAGRLAFDSLGAAGLGAACRLLLVGGCGLANDVTPAPAAPVIMLLMAVRLVIDVFGCPSDIAVSPIQVDLWGPTLLTMLKRLTVANGRVAQACRRQGFAFRVVSRSMTGRSSLCRGAARQNSVDFWHSYDLRISPPVGRVWPSVLTAPHGLCNPR